MLTEEPVGLGKAFKELQGVPRIRRDHLVLCRHVSFLPVLFVDRVVETSSTQEKGRWQHPYVKRVLWVDATL